MIKYIISVLCFIVFATACSIKEPKWYTKIPTEKGYIFASAMATSKNKQIAIDKAELDAVSKLSARLNSKIRSRIQTLLSERSVNLNSEIISSFIEEQTQIVDNIIISYTSEEKFTTQEDGKWKAYVLVKCSTENGYQMIDENIEYKLLNKKIK